MINRKHPENLDNHLVFRTHAIDGNVLDEVWNNSTNNRISQKSFFSYLGVTAIRRFLSNLISHPENHSNDLIASIETDPALKEKIKKRLIETLGQSGTISIKQLYKLVFVVGISFTTYKKLILEIENEGIFLQKGNKLSIYQPIIDEWDSPDYQRKVRWLYG